MSGTRRTGRRRVDLFSNGTEYHTWLSMNCETCRSYRPMAATSRHGCPIEVAIARASLDDGKVSETHALRGGFLEPGQNGTLVRADDFPFVKCPEYRGRDEPDDRPPRWRPRPPAHEAQLDLLDPRLAQPSPGAVEPGQED